MADIEIVNGTDGNDNLDGGPGENVYTGGLGNDQIRGIDGVNTIHFNTGDGVDTVSFAPPRTYQFARFLTEAQAALDALAGLANSALITNEYFGKFASTRLIDEELPVEIADVLRQLRMSYLGEGGGEVLGSTNVAAARDAFNALIGWINTPNTNVIQFGEGISAADLRLQLGAAAPWGGPAEFAVAINGDEGVVFRLGRADVVAGDSSSPPVLDITFRFADGSSMTAAQLLAQPPAGVMGYQYDSDDGAFLRGSIASDSLYANGGDDQVDAGGGYDQVSGGLGNDAISGGAAADTLYGEDGDDVIAAGRDGGWVIGGAGNDTYAYNLGDGLVFIDDSGIDGEVDSLSFGKDVDPATVTAYADPGAGTLTIMTGHADDFIVIEWFDPFNGNAERSDKVIERVQFIDAAGNVRVFDLAALVRSRTSELMSASDTTPVALFDSAGAAFELAGASAAGGEYADNYARTGDMFTAPTHGNVAPVAGPAIGEQTAREDRRFLFALPAGAFADADGDALTFSATMADGRPLPAWLSIDASTGTLTGTPGNGDVGAVSVTVMATDPSGEQAVQTLGIAVQNENDTPVLADALADHDVNEGSTLAFTLAADSFADVDADDALTLSARQDNGDALPSWLSFDAATRTFTAAPGMGQAGSVSVRVTATDRAGATASDVLVVNVLDVNEAPTVADPIADQSVNEDAPFRFTVPAGTFVDPDLASSPGSRVGALSLSAALADGRALPSWLSFDAGTHTFNGTPANRDVGSVNVRVTATDAGGMSTSDNFMLTVGNVNDAPILVAPLADQRATAGQTFRATLPESAFRDDDAGDTLVWTAKLADGGALPSWLTFDPGTRTFQGTPPAVTLGRMDVRVTATDSGNLRAFDDFTLDVGGGTGNTGKTLTGGRGRDTLRGSAGNDALLGLDGRDRLFGYAGDDTLRGGSEDDHLDGGVGDDYLEGGCGNDTLHGGSGVDVLQGGCGDDALLDWSRRGVLDGGTGDDTLINGSGNAMLIGGRGNDHIRLGDGNDVVAFNKGDGHDTLFGSRGGAATLSLGAGVKLSDLKLRKVRDDLVLEIGRSDSITFDDWYDRKRFQSVTTLQFVTEGMPGHGGTNPLLDDKTETFDLKAIVGTFDRARAANRGLSTWTLTNALTTFHLGGNDHAALGGDLAFQYGVSGSLAGIALAAAQDVAGSSDFGQHAQALHPREELTAGAVKLA